MTIEIIKEGYFNPKERFDAKCAHCHVEFTFQREDASFIADNDSSGGVYRLTCPTLECQKVVNVLVTTDDVPSGARTPPKPGIKSVEFDQS